LFLTACIVIFSSQVNEIRLCVDTSLTRAKMVNLSLVQVHTVIGNGLNGSLLKGLALPLVTAIEMDEHAFDVAHYIKCHELIMLLSLPICVQDVIVAALEHGEISPSSHPAAAHLVLMSFKVLPYLCGRSRCCSPQHHTQLLLITQLLLFPSPDPGAAHPVLVYPRVLPFVPYLCTNAAPLYPFFLTLYKYCTTLPFIPYFCTNAAPLYTNAAPLYHLFLTFVHLLHHFTLYSLPLYKCCTPLYKCCTQLIEVPDSATPSQADLHISAVKFTV
jgi:hypothetical protein